MQTDAERNRVKIGFEGSPELRRRVRYEALRRDMTLREYLTAVVSEAIAGPEAGDDGCEVCGSFTHAADRCPESREE